MASPNPGVSAINQIANLQTEAAAAQAFFTQFPDDSRVLTAKKIQAFCDVQLARLAPGTAAGSAALLQATSYRGNASLPVQDRFDIALAIESQSVAIAGGQQPINAAPAYLAIADKLHTEFGDQDPVYHLYTSLMLTADQPTALKVAKEVEALNSPPWAKSVANVIVNRSQLIGVLTTRSWT